jgi:hypothetical protein
MRSPTDDDIPLTLIIQRLMDADLVQPEEGLALLAEIEAWSQPAGREDAPVRSSIGHPSLVALEALAKTDWNDASAFRTALDKALALIKQSLDNLAANAAEISEPRE